MIDEAFFIKDSIYFCSWTLPNENSKLYTYDIKKRNLDSCFTDMKISFLDVDTDGTIWLAGKDNIDKQKSRVILKKINKNTAEIVREFVEDTISFISNYKRFNQFIAITLSTIDYNMYFGLGGTKDVLYFSHDNGRTWEINDISNEYDHLFNLAFYKDEKIMANVGNGKILICNIK